MSLLIVFVHTIAIYVFLAAVLSRMGRSQMTGTTPIGYMVVALLGSSVETGLYNASGSLAAGLVSAATIVALDHIASYAVARWPRLCRPLLGPPLLLVHHGRIIESHLRRAGISEEDVKAVIRKRGYDGLENVRFAVLEVDGSVGIVFMKR
jgi:uncharacterized membrane protein YcaP (DUF421 family)